MDTTVQPKNLAFPTDVKLTHKAIVMLGRLARKCMDAGGDHG